MLSSKIGVIFRNNNTKMVITRKIKIEEFWNLHGRLEIGSLERRTNFQIFQIFIFRVMAILVSFFEKITPIFDDNSKNKNRKKILLSFPFDSEHFTPFPITFWWGHFWRGGVCMSFFVTQPIFPNVLSTFIYFFINHIGSLAAPELSDWTEWPK